MLSRVLSIDIGVIEHFASLQLQYGAQSPFLLQQMYTMNICYLSLKLSCVLTCMRWSRVVKINSCCLVNPLVIMKMRSLYVAFNLVNHSTLAASEYILYVRIITVATVLAEDVYSDWHTLFFLLSHAFFFWALTTSFCREFNLDFQLLFYNMRHVFC